jgi:hypothetical protein
VFLISLLQCNGRIVCSDTIELSSRPIYPMKRDSKLVIRA